MKIFHMQLPERPTATLDGYVLDCDLTLGQDTLRPAIVICPGGGHVYCSRAEGEPVAMAFAARGFHTFVLRYLRRKFQKSRRSIISSPNAQLVIAIWGKLLRENTA